jgi:hypothetical protein
MYGGTVVGTGLEVALQLIMELSSAAVFNDPMIHL